MDSSPIFCRFAPSLGLLHSTVCSTSLALDSMLDGSLWSPPSVHFFHGQKTSEQKAGGSASSVAYNTEGRTELQLARFAVIL